MVRINLSDIFALQSSFDAMANKNYTLNRSDRLLSWIWPPIRKVYVSKWSDKKVNDSASGKNEPFHVQPANRISSRFDGLHYYRCMKCVFFSFELSASHVFHHLKNFHCQFLLWRKWSTTTINLILPCFFDFVFSSRAVSEYLLLPVLLHLIIFFSLSLLFRRTLAWLHIDITYNHRMYPKGYWLDSYLFIAVACNDYSINSLRSLCTHT